MTTTFGPGTSGWKSYATFTAIRCGEDWWKLLTSGALLVPLGFLMGMPFPAGLKLVADSGKSTVEWAWAMNAAASVLGSVSAMVIAIHFGLSITLACAAMSYLLAAGFSRTWKVV